MTDVKKVAVDIADLRVGMYISELDRPWLETSFLFQGFLIQDEEQINQIKEYCQYVFVDIEQGDAPEYRAPIKAVSSESEMLNTIKKEGIDAATYKTTVTVEKELSVAAEVFQDTKDVIASILDDVYSGKQVKLPALKKVVTPMIESVLRNPDALMWVTMIKNKDNYLYNHSLNASILAISVGRQLGLSREDLNDLATGAMLFDIGKMKLPKELLNKPGKLSEQELYVTRKHVQFGVELLAKNKAVSDNILIMIKYHHERHNGRGYPHGLKGADIPLYARIASVVDCYDAITSPRPYAEPLSSYEAIIKLYEWRDVDFQAEIIEQFIQAVGIYPTGTLVELTSGQVGVILAQSRVRKLRPRVMLVLDENKTPYSNYPVIDLIQEETDKNGKALEIMQALEPGSYDIDPEDFYL